MTRDYYSVQDHAIFDVKYRYYIRCDINKPHIMINTG